MASLEAQEDTELFQTYENLEPNFDTITNPSVGADDTSYNIEDNLEETVDNSEAGKLFLGGLSWDTTEEKLKEHFSKYGDIQDVVVMRDPVEGRSRGFGFVHFVSVEMADKALEDGHIIDNKTIDAKKAVPKGTSHRSSIGVTKIFVGGVAPGVTDSELFESFSKFGTVTSVNIMVDRETNRPRGFAFVEFQDASSVEAAVAEQEVLIADKPVEVKPAMPRVRFQPPLGRPGYQNYNPRLDQTYRVSYNRYQNNTSDLYGYQRQQYSGSKYGMATSTRPYSQNGYNYGNYQYYQQPTNQHRYQQSHSSARYSLSSGQGQRQRQQNQYYPSNSSGQAPGSYNTRPRYSSRPPQTRPAYGFHPYQR